MMTVWLSRKIYFELNFSANENNVFQLVLYWRSSKLSSCMYNQNLTSNEAKMIKTIDKKEMSEKRRENNQIVLSIANYLQQRNAFYQDASDELHVWIN